MFVHKNVKFNGLEGCNITLEITKVAEESGVKEGICSVTVLS